MPPASYKTLTFAGKVYTFPFSTRFRRHNAAELERMGESVQRGIQAAIRVYHDTDLNLADCVLDGEGRMTLAILHNLPRERVPIYDHGKLSHNDAYGIARTLNDDRRMDDAASIAIRRQERIEREAALRRRGASLRMIAEAEGVSEGQVRKDLKIAGIRRPRVVSGVDGVRYHLRPKNYQPEPGQEPGQEAEPGAGSAPDSEQNGTMDAPAEFEHEQTEVTYFQGDGGQDESEVRTGTHPVESEGVPAHSDEPVQIRSYPQRLPAYFRPGNHTDPDHPFADILAKMTALTTALTTALNGNDPHNKALLAYLLEVQGHRPRSPLFVNNRMKMVEGKHFGPQFIGLRALRALIRLAGEEGRRKPETLLKAYNEAADLEGDE